jgi:hypothetical protein
MRLSARVDIPSLGEQNFVVLNSAYLRNTNFKSDHSVNADTVAHVISGWVSILADSPVDPLKPRIVLNRFHKELVKDYRGSIGFYCDLGDKLLRSLSLGSGSSVSATFISEFKDTPVFREYLAFYRDKSPRILRFLLSFLYFAKKAPYDAENFQLTAFRSWADVEASLKELVLPHWTVTLKAIVTELLSTYNRDNFFPYHGTGAVSEEGVEANVESKCEAMRLSPSLSMYLSYLDLKLGYDRWPHTDSERNPCGLDKSRLMFVPKNYKTARSICMEPAAYMWAQQGVRYWLERSIRDGLLRDRVTLHDQSNNANACKFGSVTGLCDTIDLSAASDSVSWELVKSIFPTKVLIDLAATRTNVVQLPDGTDFKVSKFAPMGSALCFPVQCIIYSAIVILADVAHRTGREYSDPMLAKDGRFLPMLRKICRPERGSEYSFFPFQTYGDDIVCDMQITSSVMDILKELGFSVNESKSFRSDSAIRESCGKYYFNGRDVSFFRYSLSPRFDQNDRFLNGSSLSGTVDMHNRAKKHGFTYLSQYFEDSLLSSSVRVGKRILPARIGLRYSDTEPTEPLVLWGFDRFKRKRRYNKDLHRTEVRAYQVTYNRVVSIKESNLPSVNDYYYTFTGKLHASRKQGGFQVAMQPGTAFAGRFRVGTRLKWGWIPAS